jgi:galacturan 1,4-alpha-galacturonidase
MLLKNLALAAFAAPALASFIPTAQDIISSVDRVLHPQTGVELLEVEADYYDVSTDKKRKLCVLHPLGDEQDDSYNLEKAVAECGNGGILRLPDAN